MIGAKSPLSYMWKMLSAASAVSRPAWLMATMSVVARSASRSSAHACIMATRCGRYFAWLHALRTLLCSWWASCISTHFSCQPIRPTRSRTSSTIRSISSATARAASISGSSYAKSRLACSCAVCYLPVQRPPPRNRLTMPVSKACAGRSGAPNLALAGNAQGRRSARTDQAGRRRGN